MDGATLQQRIYAGMKKAAAHAGVPYDVYRTGNPIEPTQLGNKIGTANCFFAAEKRFEVPKKYKEVTRYLYADGTQLQPRDILIGTYGTFFVGDMQPLLPMQAIWCNETVDISRSVYSGTVIVPNPIASGMPAFKQLKKVDQKPVSAQIGSASTAAVPIGEWFLFVPTERDLIKQGDVVTDSIGRTYTADSIDHTEIGTVLTMRQSDVPPRN